jgi:heme/copper-type cytochrome/quinol oxidase subunit 3
MSAVMPVRTELLASLPLDERRGTRGMLLFIASEAMLFLMLFFSYFYLARRQPRWPMHPAPKLTLAFIMLAVLLLSSAVLYAGERLSQGGHELMARLAVAATIALALVFLTLQLLEYRDHLQTLKPTTDAYGSIFYTITSFHAAHLMLGVLMLAYVLCLPRLTHMPKPPHRPLANAALYWHFVDVVWIFIVAMLYVAPHIVR